MKYLIFLMFFISSEMLLSAESDTSEVLTFTDVMPEFPGGEDSLIIFLQNNIVYPEFAMENEIEGNVNIEYTINEDGSVSEFRPVSFPDSTLLMEGIRVLKLMPNWIPGKSNGKIVKVKYMVPIRFKLTDEYSEDELVSDSPKHEFVEYKSILPILYVLLFITLFFTYKFIRKNYYNDN